jgi:hypothetical protein
LAYWYDGGRPSGCCGGFIVGREVDEEAGLALALVLLAAAAAAAAVVLTVGMELCDCEEVMLFAAEDAVPLVVGAGTVERFAAEALEGVVTEVLLLDLRVLPTSLFRKFFIESDMET